MNKCKYCGKTIDDKKKYCDKNCYYAFLKDPTNNPMYGKKHKDETKKKQSKARVKAHSRFCIICGAPLKARQKNFCSQECRSIGVSGKNNPFYGRKHSVDAVNSNIEKHTNKSASPETRRKMRIAAINYRKQLNPRWHPNYNKKACNYFRKFDEENNTNGQHAENGGEYLIEELGYYLDYINFDKKLIIEFDEKRHYVGRQLKEKDKIREKEIGEYFPDFEFRRIHEKEVG
jgi:predicted nucleic acid-binding Zn ribbon protein